MIPTPTIEMAPCANCGQPVALPRLITIGSTKDPAYRAQVDPSCLKVLRSEGLTDLVPVTHQAKEVLNHAIQEPAA